MTIGPRAVPWAGMRHPFGVALDIGTMEVIEELIRLAKELDAATKRGVDPARRGAGEDWLPRRRRLLGLRPVL